MYMQIKIVFFVISLLIGVTSCGYHDSTTESYARGAEKQQVPVEKSFDEKVIEAVSSGEIASFQQLVQGQGDFNYLLKNGRRLLHEALTWKQVEIVKWCIDSGADPKLLDAEGKSAIDYAGSDKKLIYILLPQKLSEDISHFFKTLQLADPNLILSSLNEGNDPNWQNREGETALSFVIQLAGVPSRKKVASVRVLLGEKYGADPELANLAGLRPLDIASKLGEPERSQIKKLLELAIRNRAEARVAHDQTQEVGK